MWISCIYSLQRISAWVKECLLLKVRQTSTQNVSVTSYRRFTKCLLLSKDVLIFCLHFWEKPKFTLLFHVASQRVKKLLKASNSNFDSFQKLLEVSRSTVTAWKLSGMSIDGFWADFPFNLCLNVLITMCVEKNRTGWKHMCCLCHICIPNIWKMKKMKKISDFFLFWFWQWILLYLDWRS